VRVNDPHGGQAVAETSVLVDGAIPVIGQLRQGARVLGVRARRGRRHEMRRRGEGRRPGRRGPARQRGQTPPRPQAAAHPRGRATRRPQAAAHPRGPATPRPQAAAHPRGPATPRPRAAARRRPRPPRATTIRFDLSEPAAVSVAVDRARLGRRAAAGDPCRVRARKGRRCIRWVRKRSLNHAGAAGANAIRLRARGLDPGRYRLVLSAVDGVGNRSAARLLPLRVVRLPSRAP
jgi:hypothetical protein